MSVTIVSICGTDSSCGSSITWCGKESVAQVVSLECSLYDSLAYSKPIDKWDMMCPVLTKIVSTSCETSAHRVIYERFPSSPNIWRSYQSSRLIHLAKPLDN
ncbi:hypothetical protein ALC62_08339 [Cyphomyrmex costatus]|uniref:Uncharacterized protein n=1 Tax=Cyphomyrmex costatus TaxID=456900 RepID=A0A195CK75_9HYME|nr:hypothetical protein ALC62_08339 [Cyphomyrmex costatus]